MRYPRQYYQMREVLAERFPNLRPAHQSGLALWVYGTVLAGSACQNAVVAALVVLGKWEAVRQHLREWLYDGPDKAAPCQTQGDVSRCFGPLIRWVLSWWQGRDLALAIDPTLHADQVVSLAEDPSDGSRSGGAALAGVGGGDGLGAGLRDAGRGRRAAQSASRQVAGCAQAAAWPQADQAPPGQPLPAGPDLAARATARSALASPLAGPRALAGPTPAFAKHLSYVRPSQCTIA
jgi:hypothetical protein